ncbi:MAG: GNAT family N-acetyltransferase [Saprospiraceae bacterium]|nr:GNAT family N-acetyltransferase [Saprospiraceae bacterium]
MQFHFRKGDDKDKEHLQALGLMAYGQHKSAMSPENWATYYAFMSNPETFTYLMKTSTCFLCETDNQIIGMAFLVSKGHPTEMFDANWSYIRMVGVHPTFGGNGIAKKLTQLCIEHAQNTGENFVALHTSEFMHAARHIYEKMGFKKFRELQRYGKRYWVYLMEV